MAVSLAKLAIFEPESMDSSIYRLGNTQIHITF